MAHSSWRSALLMAYTSEPVRDELAAMAELDHTLEGYSQDIARALPAVALAPETFLRHLGDVLHRRTAVPPAELLANLPAADLYLAAACAAGDAAALDEFRRSQLPALRAALGKLGATPAQIDEAQQQVLDLLFVADAGRSPQILSYSGRGPLRSWVRSIAVRTCRRLMGKEQQRAAVDEVDALPEAGLDPEIAYLKQRYRDEFREAFVAALGALDERQRNVLRQHHLDGMTIDQLGSLYKVHRATAARWVAAARTKLLDGTRAELVHALGVGADEVDSIIRLVRSQLDISIHQLLR